MCGATVGGLGLDGVDASKETVIQGQVLREGEPVAGAYVRLLDSSGEFTAEIVASATGAFRFFASPGEWTLRALSPEGTGEVGVSASKGTPVDVTVELPAAS